MDIVRRTFAFKGVQFKADDDGPGGFSGYGSTWDLDQGGDVIIKGAFKDAIPDFLERGFVPVSHDWFSMPIATVKSAKEDDEGLWLEAEFHSTAAAQDVRTVMAERMERGKFVGLSIGYLLDYDQESGDVEFTEDGIRKIKRIKELAEVSVVTVPMNREAGVAAVKAGPGAVPFTERLAGVLADVSDFPDHVQNHIEMRRDFKAGRVLSAANRERLGAISSAMRDAAGALDVILEETDPDAKHEIFNPLTLRAYRGASLAMSGIEMGTE